MIKKYGLVTISCIVLLFGCSEESKIKNEKNIEQNKIENKELNITKENYEIPFKINNIISKVMEFNDPASTQPLKGVRYEVLLFSLENIPTESYSSYYFEIIPSSNMRIGPIESISLVKPINDGYLYSISFSTVYGDYTKEDLEIFNKERSFQIFVSYEGVRYALEMQ